MVQNSLTSNTKAMYYNEYNGSTFIAVNLAYKQVEQQSNNN